MQHLQDREQGHVQPLEAYQALFPGYEDIVAREYADLENPEFAKNACVSVGHATNASSSAAIAVKKITPERLETGIRKLSPPPAMESGSRATPRKSTGMTAIAAETNQRTAPTPARMRCARIPVVVSDARQNDAVRSYMKPSVKPILQRSSEPNSNPGMNLHRRSRWYQEAP
jgi:hypothetical protein